MNVGNFLCLVQADIRGAFYGPVGGGADHGFIVYGAAQFEIRSLGQGFGDIDQTAGRQHAGGLGQGLLLPIHGDVMQAVEKDHDIENARVEGHVFAEPFHIALIVGGLRRQGLGQR